MKENKYQKEFSNYVEIMSEALKRNDFKAYNVVRDMLEEAIEECEHSKELTEEMETDNFGILNHIFEEQLPALIKSNKKAVRDVIKTIKEDKNLLGEFNFYNAIREQFKGNAISSIDSHYLLEDLAKIVLKDIDQDSVKKSNRKLKKVMEENNVTPIAFVNDEMRELYECGHVILTKKRTTANMIPLIESYDSICKYIDKHKTDPIKEGKSFDEMIDDFEQKLKSNLNESEMSFVKEITDFRSPIAEKRKEKLFNKFKNECIEKINKMLDENSDNEGLKDLSNQISEMRFNKESIVSDIAKLLEIRDILMDD